MDQALYSSLVSFIWNIADDVLRDYYVRGKYRDVILPMTVLRRLDALLEDSKQAVLAMNAILDNAGIIDKEAALRSEAGQAFYNTSPFVKSVPTFPTPGLTRTPRRSAMKSRLRAISTSRSRCVRWTRYAPT